MNVIDIIILICFIPALIQGIRKGFVTQAVAIIALLLGAWMSYKFAVPVGNWIRNFTDVSGTTLQVIAFVVIFIIVFCVLILLGKAITKIIRIALLGWVDRLLGVAFSFIKAFLVVGLLLLLFDALNSKFELVKPETISGSLFYEPIKTISNVVFPYIKQMIFEN